MRRKRLLWQLYPSYLLVIILSLTAIAWYASSSYKQFSLDRTAADLEVRSRLIRDLVADRFSVGDTLGIQQLCGRAAQKSSSRITVILPSGTVICDSQEDPMRMDNHADRPEIIEALSTGSGRAIRYSFTLGQNMMYVAVPVEVSGRTVAVLRTSIPITDIDESLNTVFTRIAIGGLVIVLIAAALSFWVARKVSRPLEQIRRGAKRFAAGELQHKLPVSPVREIGGVAEAMNSMAGQLHDRIQAIVRQRNERDAILASMVEGVLAVDTDERLIGLNRAAARLFDITREEARGKTIQEIVRNPALIEFIGRVFAQRESEEAEIVLHKGETRHLQAHGTILRDAEDSGIGVLVVLNDITRIRRLEAVRRDFVANVSHELKTPVTSIKGFAETLVDGTIDNPAEAKRFVSIIARQADRLEAIIDDLLTLSRLEQEADEASIRMAETPLRPILEAVVQACGVKAGEKDITIDIDCDDAVTARINGPLLEQAIINLVDNAVKYSDSGQTIKIDIEQKPDRITVNVTDYGTGITEEHLPRLFERFYRVDRARSRTLGGTGLGLSIVKHITNVHGGYPEVRSVIGRGSTFSIHLPVGKSPIRPEHDAI